MNRKIKKIFYLVNTHGAKCSLRDLMSPAIGRHVLQKIWKSTKINISYMLKSAYCFLWFQRQNNRTVYFNYSKLVLIYKIFKIRVSFDGHRLISAFPVYDETQVVLKR